jgi:hypothetical protein
VAVKPRALFARYVAAVADFPVIVRIANAAPRRVPAAADRFHVAAAGRATAPGRGGECDWRPFTL